jgi:dUTP pyrophosphatase
VGFKIKIMQIKFTKTHPNAITPSYATNGDAGLDLTAVHYNRIDSEHIKYYFGIAVEIPTGYVGLIFPRSSCYKKRQLMSNCVGVIDSGYRGEISTIMLGTSQEKYNEGDRVAQLIVMPYPNIEMVEVDKLSESERGSRGYGSTGNKNPFFELS